MSKANIKKSASISMMVLVAIICLSSVGWSSEPENSNKQLDDLAAVIMPQSHEVKWQQIPWETDLNKGLDLAREERRPIFLWVTGDDPLQRC